ncbi:MAG: LptF/LptG family permease [Bacteroidales bacterium]|nr:LptF/LptG family permease [Bacteroidales bacterium]
MLKIIDRYIIKKFMGTFFYAISLLILIVIIFDVSENIDSFIKNEAPLKAILIDYYFNFIPYFINLFIYLFTFISVIFFTSKMAGDTEIIAILSSGVSFRRLLYPYLLSAFVLAIFSFYLGNFLIPKTNQTRRVFKNTYMEELVRDQSRNLHLQIEPNTFAYVETYNRSLLTGYKFSLEKFDKQQLVYKLMSDKIVLDTVNGKWTLKDYFIRTIDSAGNQHIVKGTLMDTALALKPADLYKVKEVYEEMNLYELNAFIASEKEKGSIGYKNFEIEKHKRLAGPVAIIILTIIGVALSSRKVRGGIGMHLGAGIALTFSYILLMQVSTVFSAFGNLSPAIASWIPNIIFLFIGLYLLKKAPK